MDKIAATKQYGPVRNRQEIGFGFKDARGREVGAFYSITEMTYMPSDTGWGFAVSPDQTGRILFEVCYQPQRNGIGFGASQPRPRFETLEAAQDYADHMVEKYRAAQAKKFSA